MIELDRSARRQLPLPFGLDDGQGSDGTSLSPFLTGPSNEDARRMLQAWQDTLSDPGSRHSILIGGASGTGKSLLLDYIGRDLGVPVRTGQALCDRTKPLPDDVVILADDMHLCSPSDIIRLINSCVERDRPYCLAGTGKPHNWGAEGDTLVDDLASRLSATPTARLEKPDEDMLARAIEAGLARRQVRIPAAVAAHAASRLRRSFHAVELVVERLDSEALERQKAIDKTLVNQVLSDLPEAVL